MRKLTDKQEEILNVIYNYVLKNGFSPSIREIMASVNISSTSTIKGHLDKMKAKNYITWREGMPRTIKIINK